MQGQRRNGAVYIPLLLCQPGTYICSSFYFFWANMHRHSLGWWSGFWWIDTTAKVCKTFTTAFRAANSSLKDFGLRAMDLQGYFKVLFGSVGVGRGAWIAGLFCIIPVITGSFGFCGSAFLWGCPYNSYYVT